MRIFKSIGLYITLGILFLGYIMVRAGLKNNNPLFIWLGLIGIAVGLIIFLIIILRKKSEKNKAENEKLKWILNLKKMGSKTTIKLEDTRYKQIHLNNPIENDSYEPDSIETYISPYLKEDEDSFDYIIEIPFKGDIIPYQFKARQNTTDLKIHFAIRKTTLLYSLNNEIYLDLEFLET